MLIRKERLNKSFAKVLLKKSKLFKDSSPARKISIEKNNNEPFFTFICGLGLTFEWKKNFLTSSPLNQDTPPSCSDVP
jgi:hypothetical protein